MSDEQDEMAAVVGWLPEATGPISRDVAPGEAQSAEWMSGHGAEAARGSGTNFDADEWLGVVDD